MHTALKLTIPRVLNSGAFCLVDLLDACSNASTPEEQNKTQIEKSNRKAQPALGRLGFDEAPPTGLEPVTWRLTAARSTN